MSSSESITFSASLLVSSYLIRPDTATLMLINVKVGAAQNELGQLSFVMVLALQNAKATRPAVMRTERSPTVNALNQYT